MQHESSGWVMWFFLIIWKYYYFWLYGIFGVVLWFEWNILLNASSFKNTAIYADTAIIIIFAHCF